MDQCVAITLKGERCKNKAKRDHLCGVHMGSNLSVKPGKTTKSKESQGCVEQFKGHYVTKSRKSPAFPANECPGRVMKGRDGEMWVSKPTSYGVYRWVKQ